MLAVSIQELTAYFERVDVKCFGQFQDAGKVRVRAVEPVVQHVLADAGLPASFPERPVTSVQFSLEPAYKFVFTRYTRSCRFYLNLHILCLTKRCHL